MEVTIFLVVSNIFQHVRCSIFKRDHKSPEAEEIVMIDVSQPAGGGTAEPLLAYLISPSTVTGEDEPEPPRRAQPQGTHPSQQGRRGGGGERLPNKL